MTKEPIIIDDVDVSECNYYADGKCTNNQMIQSNCKNVAVCYFKEYKRKEQECEELRQVKKDLPDIQMPYVILYRQIKEQYHKLEQECEELKKSVRSNKDKRKRAIERYLNLKEFTNKEFKKLEVEKNNQITKDNINDIFKKTIEHHKNNANMTAYEVDNTAYVIQLEKVIFRIREERDQLKQALQEIFKCLIMANRADKIIDTLWIDSSTTLWDYIAKTLGLEGDQLEIEEQILQKCEVIDEES